MYIGRSHNDQSLRYLVTVIEQKQQKVASDDATFRMRGRLILLT